MLYDPTIQAIAEFSENTNVVVLKEADWLRIKRIVRQYPTAYTELKLHDFDLLPIEIVG